MSDEDENAAAEYVLGTLPADERARFVRRLATDNSLRAVVRSWQMRLAPLDDAVAAEAPPAAVWQAIERATGTDAAIIPLYDARAAGNITRLERRLAAWRSAAFVTGALAAGLAAFAVFDRLSPPEVAPTGRYVAVVDSGGHEPALIAEVDTETGIIRVRSFAAQAPAGHSLELWHVGDDGKPRSLGVLQAGGEAQTIQDAVARGPVSGIIAVSVEPEGGSPTGQPTGEVVYTGQLVPLE